MHPFISPLFLSPALVHSPAVFLHFHQVHSTKWTTSHQAHWTFPSTLPQGLLYHLQWQQKEMHPAIELCAFPPSFPAPACTQHCAPINSSCWPSFFMCRLSREPFPHQAKHHMKNSVMIGNLKRISRWQKQAIIPLKKTTFSFLLLIGISSIKNFVKPLVINPKSSCSPICLSLTYFSWDDQKSPSSTFPSLNIQYNAGECTPNTFNIRTQQGMILTTFSAQKNTFMLWYPFLLFILQLVHWFDFIPCKGSSKWRRIKVTLLGQ